MMAKVYIDINCDVGEGLNNEANLMPYISSCNIACGGHAGDAVTMRSVVRMAKQQNVKIGAHPSYPDKKNFGRKSLEIDPNILIASVRQQMAGFISILEEENAKLNHIKPHGALYNDIARDEVRASLFLEAISAYQAIPIYVPFRSTIEDMATTNGFRVHLEAFADRNYNANLSLVSRDHENALIDNPKDVLKHLLGMVKKGIVHTVDGSIKSIKAQTFCIHGDTPSALEILMYLSEELPNHQVEIKK